MPVSDAEIAQLLAVALSDAMNAVGQANPEKALRLRTREARSGLHESFMSLPRELRSDPTLLTEYRNALELQGLTLELALQLVGTIQRYAGLSERAAAIDV